MPEISSLQIDWNFGNSKLYLCAEDSFFAANGTPHQAERYPNGWAYKFDCTAALGKLTIPAKAVDATTNSSKPQVRYRAYLIDDQGIQRPFMLTEFRLPHDLGDTITWEQISAVQNRSTSQPPEEFLTYRKMSELFRTLAYNEAFIDAVVNNANFVTAISESDDIINGLVSSSTLINALANSSDFVDALAQNTEFISGVASNTDLMTAIAANTELQEALIANDDFLDALLTRMFEVGIITAPVLTVTNPATGELHLEWTPSAGVFPIDGYIIHITIAED